MDAGTVVKMFALAGLAVIIAAWIAESYKNGNRFWVNVRFGLDMELEWLYDHCYLAVWRAMMRHTGDPSYSYEGRHAK